LLSFWEKKSFLNYDYIIVGSGILGLSTACEIKETYPDKEILVIERGIFPTGASTKNAGFLCYGSLTEILSDIKLKGEDNAVSLIDKRWQGIQLLKKRVSESKMGYYNYGGYELIDDKFVSALEKVEYVNNLLKDIFPYKVFTVNNDAINTFGFNKSFVRALVYSPYESQLDTGLLMQTMLKYVHFLGIHLINGCMVNEIDGSSREVKVMCEHNILKEAVTFTAKQVIVCANAFMEKLFPELEVKPGRGHVLVTEPIEGLKIKGVYHYDEGYYYFRNYENRIIFGGGRNLDFAEEETTEFEFNQKIINDLEDKLQNIIIPGIKYEVEDRWTGIMGFTADKLPMVKKINDNVIAAISCNGMGVALSSLIAKEIVGLCFSS